MHVKEANGEWREMGCALVFSVVELRELIVITLSKITDRDCRGESRRLLVRNVLAWCERALDLVSDVVADKWWSSVGRRRLNTCTMVSVFEMVERLEWWLLAATDGGSGEDVVMGVLLCVLCVCVGVGWGSSPT